MSKKQKANPEAKVLELLKDVLPQAVSDQHLVQKIYAACEKQISKKVRVENFKKYCERAELPSLENESIKEVQRQFEESFGIGKVTLVPDEEKKIAAIEVVVDDGVLEGKIAVGAKNGDEEDPEFKPKFVPFPVALPTDPELVWALGRAETLPPEEAAILLAKAQEDFWASKAGQKLIRDRVERSFPEFISRVPSKVLTEVGLKRHYKEPEPLKQLITRAE